MSAERDFALRREYELEERDKVEVDSLQEAKWALKLPPPVPQEWCPGSRVPGSDFGLLVATCSVCAKPYGNETLDGRVLVERHTRDAPHIDAPKAAMLRLPIRLITGRVARLVYWPVPAAQRRSESKGRFRNRARVEVRPGVVISVKAHEIIFEEGLNAPV